MQSLLKVVRVPYFVSEYQLFMILLFMNGGFTLKKAQRCQWAEGEYSCTHMPKHISSKLNIPSLACAIHDCSNCIVANRTFILGKDYQLITPERFLLRPTARFTHGHRSSFYSCSLPNGNLCDCDQQLCTGSREFCQTYQCGANASCVCHLTGQESEIVHISQDESTVNPILLTFETCFMEKNFHSTRSLHRKLLEHEQAVYSSHNLTFSFIDPIVKLPAPGRVIIRSPEFEHIFSVPDDYMIELPFEILAFKSSITIIYIHPSGRTVTGIIHVAGKTVCQLRRCILCPQILQTLKCWSRPFQALIFMTGLIFILCTIWCLKTILRTILSFFRVCAVILYGLFKLFKILARCSLLLGSCFGTTVRSSILKVHAFLELYANDVHVSPAQLVVLALCLTITSVEAECTSHTIIQSELRTCETTSDGTLNCKMFTTAELTLPALDSEMCVWFSDDKNNHLFSLKIKLEAVLCKFHTQREYFTFPVRAKHISQISCFYNEYCGQGEHCAQRTIGKKGLRFEAETAESRQFPGISKCTAGGIGVGCTILTRAACNFQRNWYEPDLLNSYEVSSITGHKCEYEISIHHIENNTISRMVISDTTYTATGVRVTLLGAYDQPQLHISDKFIQRVGDKAEGFLAPASPRNHPRAGQLGAVQANKSFTTDFIFDPTLSTWDFYEDILRCHSPRDPVLSMQQSQQEKLPLERDLHLLQIKNGNLVSTLLYSSAVRIQLHFSNYKLAVQTVTVCPSFESASFNVQGCYNCPILARLSFRAHSTCQSGVVLINFQNIHVHTKALRLTMEPQNYEIKFLAVQKCSDEKICLQATNIVQCQTLEWCLDEPSIELVHLNTNYTKLKSHPTNNWTEWWKLPNMHFSMFILKFLGSTLFIVCVLITIFSTVMTCCCRSR